MIDEQLMGDPETTDAQQSAKAIFEVR